MGPCPAQVSEAEAYHRGLVWAGFLEEADVGVRPEQWVGCGSWDLGEHRYGGESQQDVFWSW